MSARRQTGESDSFRRPSLGKIITDKFARTPRPAPPTPPQLRLRLRTKLVVAMAFAALVPVAIIAMIATGVILSSLEGGLREDADRQLTVGLNLILRSVERLGDETVQLAESSDLTLAMRTGPAALEAWFAREGAHVPSARLQLVDANGNIIFDRVIGGAERRFVDAGIKANDPMVAEGQTWTR